MCFLGNLHNVIIGCWSAKCLRQQWKNANIILVHKLKGDRAECCNSCGISLPSAAGWVLGKVMHTCLLEIVVNHVMPESQCGFLRGLSTIDMIFVARRQQEKCHEQHQDICMAFVDQTKAFDKVNSRPSLEQFAQIWLLFQVNCHTTTISYRHLCSSCHGCVSVLLLSCWSGSETNLCYRPNHLKPASSRYYSCITPWPPIIWSRWNWVSSWLWSLQPATSPGKI